MHNGKKLSFKGVALFYLLALGLAGLLFAYVLNQGQKIDRVVSIDSVAKTESPGQVDMLFHILLAFATIVGVTRSLGALARRYRQPPVIGEIVGGILLGPSLFGALVPHWSNFLLPSATLPLVSAVAQIGIILYMYLVGLELELGVLKKAGHTILAISNASVILPFTLGSALALILYKDLAPGSASFLQFSFFIGVSMSVTAFPVLARILSDLDLGRTRMGAVALSCAAIDDVTAWCLLAVAIGLVQGNPAAALWTVVLTILYLAIMFVAAKPFAQRFFPIMTEKVSEATIAMTMFLVFLSAIVTELIGIHAVFGAFILGVITPNKEKILTPMKGKMEPILSVLFLPAFFALTGAKTQINLLGSEKDWLYFAAIIFVAVLGKFGGAMLAAKFAGFSWRDSTGLGILMNSRGMVELIVLNIGLDLGVISPRLFAMLVLMALVTTFMTTPVLGWVIRDGSWKKDRIYPIEFNVPDLFG